MRVVDGVKYYNTKELAEKLDVKYTTIQSWLKHKIIEAEKLGGRWYIAEDKIEQIKKIQKVKG